MKHDEVVRDVGSALGGVDGVAVFAGQSALDEDAEIASDDLDGSDKDNFLPDADCDEMTSPMASGFTTFMTTMVQGAPDCGGTIRYAGGREFYRMRTAALLHRPEQWTGFKFSAADKAETAFRRRHATDLAKAEATLADYYVQTFHLDTATANRDASGVTNVLVNQAYNLCG